MTLQLHSFLDANSVERVAIDVCTAQGEGRHPKDRFALSVTEKAGAVNFLCPDVERHPKDYFRTNISHQECFFKESYAISLTRRPSSLAKVGCMALTTLPESSRADIDSLGRW